MKRFRFAAAIFVAMLLAIQPGKGSGTAESGQVQLPLDLYTKLLERANDPTQPPRPAPAGYALGTAQVVVSVQEIERHASAAIQVQLGIDVLESEWVRIPVLPAGTPVESVQVDGKAVQLLSTGEGLAWSTDKAGSYAMRLVYTVDADRSDAGFSLPIPLPQAAAVNLQATIPGTSLDATVIPAAGTKVDVSGNTTRVTATVPTTSGVQLSWRVPVLRGHTISRAGYAGTLRGDAIVWTGTFRVELFADETVTLPLLPRTVTLSDVAVDGRESSILVEQDRFATLVKGRGLHEVVVVFQTPVVRPQGPPRVDLRIPQIPVSRFELTLPGKKELAVTPASNVSSRTVDDATTALVHVPMTEQVSFSWSEAVPDDVRAELRSNASTYHLIHAEEGVMYVRALVAYEITRGESNVIDLELPPGIQINRVESPSGAIADWRLKSEDDGRRIVNVFLDRQLSGDILIDVYYDRSLGAEAVEGGIDIPLIRSLDAQRQKGMIALLSSSELTLRPIESANATKVGENQLPAFVREAVQMTVAHTFKYADPAPALSVEIAEPERAQGKFDAQVDTLISLGDVTLTGSATIQANVKSGRIMDFRLELPEGVSLLGLTAPALRTYRINEEGGKRFVDIEFTQEMEGLFRIDLTYERILGDPEAEVEVPTIAVAGAEVEQGRLAVEALSAAEVQPSVTEQLSSLDINELPQQLVLRTTNPILLAYKYVHAETPHRLALQVTRHAVLGVQEAAIDDARYKTLFTRDGLFVTTAEFTVRNSRKQFLRVRLPQASEVWSTFVDGKPEKPALADGGDGDVLIKIINSTRPFVVRLIYATAGERIGRLGTIESLLPSPDILVTHSHWDVFLPEELAYGTPSTNMDLAEDRSRVSREEMQDELHRLESGAVVQQAIQPLRISVPAAGVHYAFRKLYANQRGQSAWFELPYASAGGAAIGQSAGLLGTLLFWLGVALCVRFPERGRRMAALGLSTVGAVVTATATLVYHVGAMPSLVASVLAAVSLAAFLLRRTSLPWSVPRTAGGPHDTDVSLD